MSSKSDSIRILNDHVRTTFTGGLIVLTRSIAELDEQLRAQILAAVRTFNQFGPANDPYQEHDMAFFEVAGDRYFFKLDYFDVHARFHSPDPADASCTCRVLTIGHHSDY
jgi:hypothetical protein